jgi:hypothetical protein
MTSFGRKLKVDKTFVIKPTVLPFGDTLNVCGHLYIKNLSSCDEDPINVFSEINFNELVNSENILVDKNINFNEYVVNLDSDYTIDLNNGSLQIFNINDDIEIDYINGKSGTYIFIFNNINNFDVLFKENSGWYQQFSGQPIVEGITIVSCIFSETLNKMFITSIDNMEEI